MLTSDMLSYFSLPCNLPSGHSLTTFKFIAFQVYSKGLIGIKLFFEISATPIPAGNP